MKLGLFQLDFDLFRAIQQRRKETANKGHVVSFLASGASIEALRLLAEELLRAFLRRMR